MFETTIIFSKNGFFAGVWDGSKIHLYKNGIEIGSTDLTGSLTSGSNNNFIGYINGFGHFNGTIDEVHIYNRALTSRKQQEIQQHYQKGIHLTLVVSNKGRVNLGKDFVIVAKIGGRTVIRNVTLASDLTPGRFEKIELVNLTQVGDLNYLRINSMAYPDVYDEIKEIQRKYC